MKGREKVECKENEDKRNNNGRSDGVLKNWRMYNDDEGNLKREN